MQTPFEERPKAEERAPHSEWAARSDAPRRSVFGNYSPEPDHRRPEETPPPNRQSAIGYRQSGQSPLTPASTPGVGLQAAIDTAVARAFLYQFLARAFEDPAIESWTWLTDAGTRAAVRSAASVLALHSPDTTTNAAALTAQLRPDRFEPFQAAYVVAFGHAARGDCPLNEIEYGDLKADPLFQPHRLADLAAFYRAFGLEVADDAAERPDHLGMELEFMSVLAAKEAYACEHQLDAEHGDLCRDAQKKFLREHLGRWSPAFARRLARAAVHETLAALAEFLRAFIAADCARFGLAAGCEDLLLRPVDEAAERLCDTCALTALPPGALTMKET